MENVNAKLGHMNMKNKDIESNKYFKKVVDSVDINCPESYRKTARYFDSYDMNKSFKDGWDNCTIRKWNKEPPEDKTKRYIAIFKIDYSIHEILFNKDGELIYYDHNGWEKQVEFLGEFIWIEKPSYKNIINEI